MSRGSYSSPLIYIIFFQTYLRQTIRTVILPSNNDSSLALNQIQNHLKQIDGWAENSKTKIN